MRVDNFLATYNNSVLNDNSKRTFETNKSHFNAELSSKESKKEAEFDRALKEQTDAFESFLIKTVLDISLKNKASIFEKDASDDIYSSMYNDTMSKALSGGIGFSKLLFDFLKERG